MSRSRRRSRSRSRSRRYRSRSRSRNGRNRRPILTYPRGVAVARPRSLSHAVELEARPVFTIFDDDIDSSAPLILAPVTTRTVQENALLMPLVATSDNTPIMENPASIPLVAAIDHTGHAWSPPPSVPLDFSPIVITASICNDTSYDCTM